MKKRYIVGMVVFLGLNVWGILRSQPPPPTGIMKPSFFDRPQEVGAVVFRRLYAPMIQNKLIVYGVRPNDIQHREVLEGLLATATAEKQPIDVVLREPQLEVPLAPSNVEIVDAEFNSDPAELVAKVNSYISQGKRVLIYTANTLSSHLIKQNPMERFEAIWGKPVYTISSVDIGLKVDSTFVQDPPCVGSERDGQGTAALGCAALQKGRAYQRKDLDLSRIVALMDQRGASDLLLFLSFPRR